MRIIIELNDQKLELGDIGQLESKNRSLQKELDALKATPANDNLYLALKQKALQLFNGLSDGPEKDGAGYIINLFNIIDANKASKITADKMTQSERMKKAWQTRHEKQRREKQEQNA